jgi:hypothetical protein
MKRFTYTYCVVRYIHDPAAGEALNIGVLLCAPEIDLISVKLEYHFERLSETFANFDGEAYRKLLKQLEAGVMRVADQESGALFRQHDVLTDAHKLAARLVPDRDLSLQFGPMMAGVSSDPADELHHIFVRMVQSQYPEKRKERRTDEDVWAQFQKRLAGQCIIPYLRPKAFTSSEYSLKFDHAFKNQRWHVLQPVTMDYSRPEGLQERATKILGATTILQGDPELGKLYVLLGEPRNSSNRVAYEKAKNLLHKRMPVEHEIVEEREADEFAKEIASYMREHGVIKD